MHAARARDRDRELLASSLLAATLEGPASSSVEPGEPIILGESPLRRIIRGIPDEVMATGDDDLALSFVLGRVADPDTSGRSATLRRPRRGRASTRGCSPTGTWWSATPGRSGSTTRSSVACRLRDVTDQRRAALVDRLPSRGPRGRARPSVRRGLRQAAHRAEALGFTRRSGGPKSHNYSYTRLVQYTQSGINTERRSKHLPTA